MGIKWNTDQLNAIELENSALLVSAAAGSGKTAVLVERIIRKITRERNPVDVDRLLVVTFTNAAASEMKARISKRLGEKLEENPTDENINRQLALINRSNISTIHSFCLKVIDENFHKINLDPGYRIADENEIRMIMDEALEETLDFFYDKAEDEFLNISDIIGGSKNDRRLEDNIIKIYKYSRSFLNPDRWIKESAEKYKVDKDSFRNSPFMEIVKKDIFSRLNESIFLLNEAEKIIASETAFDKFKDMLKSDKGYIENAINLSINAESIDDIKEALSTVEFIRMPILKKDSYDENIKKTVSSIRTEYKNHIASISKNWLFESEEANIEMMNEMYSPLKKLSEVILMFSEKYNNLKREKNVIDFNDLEHFALSILVDTKTGEKTEAAEEYANYFEEILIDEYQDSNDVQEALLNSVSRNSQNVFMVGDVKQSIYRFRQAKPQLFMRKYKDYLLPEDINAQMAEGRKIILNSNYRSRREVLSSVNDVFSKVMTEDAGELNYTEDEALKYASMEFTDDKEFKSTVEIKLVEDSKIEETEEFISEDVSEIMELSGVELEARYVADRIKRLVEEEQLPVFDKLTGEKRPVRYKDIVILLRATSKVSKVYKDALNEIAVPVFADTANGYFDSLEIRTIMSCLMVIDNSRQDIPLLAVMRSPIFNFTETEFIEIRDMDRNALIIDCVNNYLQKDREKLEEKEKNLFDKCVFMTSMLKTWREESLHMELDEFIWKIYQDTAYFEYVGAMPNGVQRQANLKMLFQKAYDYERTSFKGLFNFVSYMNTIKEKSGDFGDAKILGESEDVVRIMSIHKSKGLEFPVVFLSNASKGFNRMDERSHITLHEDLGIGIDFTDPIKGIKNKTIAKMAINKKIGEAALAEEMRILYVAMTRAKEKLFITASTKDANKDLNIWAQELSFNKEIMSPLKALSAKSYLDWIMPVILRKDSMSIFKGQITQGIFNNIYGNKEDFTIEVITKNDLINQAVLNEEENLDRFYNGKAIEDKELIKILNYKYPHSEAVKSPSKISVSVIKKRVIEENEEERAQNIDLDEIKEERALKNKKQERKELKKPLFLSGTQELAASEKGTAFHNVMLFINPSVKTEDEVLDEMNKLYEKEIMLKEEIDSVDPKKVLAFFKSDLGRRFIKASEEGRLYKEEVFYREISIKEAFESKNYKVNDSENEKLMIIGIIDAFFLNEEKSGYVLLDYKTDRLKGLSEKDLIERYRAQIMLYKEALESITGMKVTESYLYSTYLDKEIKIE